MSAESPYIDQLAERICREFLDYAAQIPGEKWREQWVWINRASGIIAGAAITLSDFGPLEGVAREIVAERILGAIRARVPTPGKQMGMFLEGLEVRLLRCFMALDGQAKQADALKLRDLRLYASQALTKRRAS